MNEGNANTPATSAGTRRQALAAEIGALLKARGETLAVAESSAGGLISAALLAVPGASAWYEGGVVFYTHAARRALLGVADEEVAAFPVLSTDYIARCAEAARQRLGTTWALAELGATGPTGSRYGDPAGTLVLAVAGPTAASQRQQTGDAERGANMERFADAALELLHGVLTGQ